MAILAILFVVGSGGTLAGLGLAIALSCFEPLGRSRNMRIEKWLYPVLAGVAGIMVFISLDELLPAAREYGEHHLSIYGLVIGMIVIAVSLLLFL